jgi:DNA invertase Pin-like site-specific DNA recombinase
LANVGYARVSTLDQDFSLQLDALAAAGCDKIFEDRASGVRAGRAGLKAALARRGVGFHSLTVAIDITTPGGRLMFHLFAAPGQAAGSERAADV